MLQYNTKINSISNQTFLIFQKGFLFYGISESYASNFKGLINLKFEVMKKMVFSLILISSGWAFGQGAFGEVIGSVVDSKSS